MINAGATRNVRRGWAAPTDRRDRLFPMRTAAERREELEAVHREASGCTRCPQLVQARTTVVVGTGNPDADLLFVGQAPTREEDASGVPFAARTGELLTELLAGIGLARDDVFLANVVKCHGAGNRDPLPQEVANCQNWLFRQLELVQPKVVCTLGGFATKLLRGDPAPITRLHGREEVRTVGPRAVRLYPLFHPAAALYTRSLLDGLRADFARLPELLALEAPVQPEPARPAVPDPDLALEAGAPVDPEPPEVPETQLGLF
jgi:uracil-DNA glycosylase